MRIIVNSTPPDAGGYTGFYPSYEHLLAAAECCVMFVKALRGEISTDSIELVEASFFTARRGVDMKEPAVCGLHDGQGIKDQPAMKLRVVMNYTTFKETTKLEVEETNWRGNASYILPSKMNYFVVNSLIAKLAFAIKSRKRSLAKRAAV